jgi:exoribonuclease R
MPFKLQVSDRKYREYNIINSSTLVSEKTTPQINPIEYKLFNQDIFSYDNATKKLTLEHSTTRSMKNIPGVLVLEGNKRYGSHKNKFLYKCIPDDRRFPIFMVPYTINIGFNKRLFNKYIVFKFLHWEDKHPRATIVQVIGDVTELSNFYEYQLYCKSLYASIQNFNKTTMIALKEKSEDEYIEYMYKIYSIQDRREHDIISIDPKTSKDFDDAFSIIDDDSKDSFCLSIYISNVSFWMDAMDLWDSFSQRISTIYLPDRKRPMLPTILSDALCSLQENRIRFAFTLDIIINKNTFKIENTTFSNSCICVKQNLRYDTDEQENNTTYQIIFKYIKSMNKVNKYVDSISTSHDVVAYTMILMNYISAKYLSKQKKGIFRSVKTNNSFSPPDNVPENVQKFLKMWNSFGGKYVKHKGMDSHDMLELDAYVHITSPIRRLVDLLNIMIIQDELGLMKLEGKRLEFYEKWTNDASVEYINKTMRSIRKVQNDCSLLCICSDNTDILLKEHNGFIFDKITRNDGLYQYMVYFPEFKMVNRFTSRYEKENLSNQKFKLFVFTDEIQLKQKIRIELIG